MICGGGVIKTGCPVQAAATPITKMSKPATPGLHFSRQFLAVSTGCSVVFLKDFALSPMAATSYSLGVHGAKLGCLAALTAELSLTGVLAFTAEVLAQTFSLKEGLMYHPSGKRLLL